MVTANIDLTSFHAHFDRNFLFGNSIPPKLIRNFRIGSKSVIGVSFGSDYTPESIIIERYSCAVVHPNKGARVCRYKPPWDRFVVLGCRFSMLGTRSARTRFHFHTVGYQKISKCKISAVKSCLPMHLKRYTREFPITVNHTKIVFREGLRLFEIITMTS